MTDSFLSRGGVWVVIQAAFTTALAIVGMVFRGQWDSRFGMVAGGIIFVAGAIIGVAGTMALGKNRTAFPKPLESAAFVQHGIYRRVRHPLYCSLILMAVGWGLLWESGLELLMALFFALFLSSKASVEEAWMRRKFREYAFYQTQVPKLIPWT